MNRRRSNNAMSLTNKAISIGFAGLTVFGAASVAHASANKAKVTRSGAGWDEVHVESGSTKHRIVVLRDAKTIDRLPLSAASKKYLKDEGVPALLREAKRDEMVILDLDALQSIASQAKQQQQMQRGIFPKIPKCPAKTDTQTRDINVNKPVSIFKKEANKGGLSGSVRLDGSVKVTGKLRVNMTRRKGIYNIIEGKCEYLFGKLNYVEIDASTNSSLAVTVSGEFGKEWHKVFLDEEYKVLDKVVLIAGVFPLRIVGHMPLEIGLDASAKAKVKASTKVRLTGKMKYRCKPKGGGCNGTKNFSLQHGDGGNRAEFDASARALVTAYADTGLRVSLYVDKLAYAQVNARVNVIGDLWAYAGNTCGDGNVDGKAEFVKALTLNASIGVDGRVSAGLARKEQWAWEEEDIFKRNLAFWAAPGSTALSPVFYARAAGNNGAKATIKMRPCWPYQDTMNYRIDWGDGQSSDVSASPKSSKDVTHTYKNKGQKRLTGTAGRDAARRKIERSSKATVNVFSGGGNNGNGHGDGFNNDLCKPRPGHKLPAGCVL